MEIDLFEKIVDEAFNMLPDKFLKQLNNVAIVVAEEPSEYQLKKMKMRKGDGLLGLYEGVPLNQRGHYSNVLPDKITIFKNAIERQAEYANTDLKKIVFHTIWHEIAHHFGFNEKEVGILEKKQEKIAMKYGFTCGAFDLLHPGHIRMLKWCSQHCDYLIVGVQEDPSIDRSYKHKPTQIWKAE